MHGEHRWTHPGLEHEVCVVVHWSPAKMGLELSDRGKDFMGEEGCTGSGRRGCPEDWVR